MVQGVSCELTEKMLFDKICASWKQMLGIDRKGIFSIKKYLLIQIMTSSCFENFQYPWWKHFSIDFFWQYIYIFWSNAFLIVFHFSTNYQLSALFSKVNAIKKHWMSLNAIGHPQKRTELLLVHSSLL